jgi:hypothetical protein
MHVDMQKYCKKEKKKRKGIKKWTSVQKNKTMGTLIPA